MTTEIFQIVPRQGYLCARCDVYLSFCPKTLEQDDVVILPIVEGNFLDILFDFNKKFIIIDLCTQLDKYFF